MIACNSMARGSLFEERPCTDRVGFSPEDDDDDMDDDDDDDDA